MKNEKVFPIFYSFLKCMVILFVISIAGCGSGPNYTFLNTSSQIWTFIDGGGPDGINKNPLYSAENSRLTVFDNNLYSSWEESNAGPTQIRVGLYNGNDSAPSWMFVDSGGANGINHDPSEYASTAELTVFESKLYAVWSEFNGNANQIRIAVYNGNKTAPLWTLLDGGGTSGINQSPSHPALNPQMIVFANKLYVAWSESNGVTTQTRIVVYNGNDLAPVWTFVDGGGANGINQNPAHNASDPQMIVFANKLYVAWSEFNGITTQTRIVVYNGNDLASVWTFVDGGGANGINQNPAHSAANPQIIVFANKLYATWSEFNGATTEIRMAVYNGNDLAPIWTFVDGGSTNGINQNPANNASNPQPTVFNTNLYAIWSEFNGTATQIRISVYNGNDSAPSWLLTDGGGTHGINFNSADNAIHPQLTVFAGKLYGNWTEFNGSANQIRVAVTK